MDTLESEVVMTDLVFWDSCCIVGIGPVVVCTNPPDPAQLYQSQALFYCTNEDGDTLNGTYNRYRSDDTVSNIRSVERSFRPGFIEIEVKHFSFEDGILIEKVAAEELGYTNGDGFRRSKNSFELEALRDMKSQLEMLFVGNIGEGKLSGDHSLASTVEYQINVDDRLDPKSKSNSLSNGILSTTIDSLSDEVFETESQTEARKEMLMFALHRTKAKSNLVEDILEKGTDSVMKSAEEFGSEQEIDTDEVPEIGVIEQLRDEELENMEGKLTIESETLAFKDSEVKISESLDSFSTNFTNSSESGSYSLYSLFDSETEVDRKEEIMILTRKCSFEHKSKNTKQKDVNINSAFTNEKLENNDRFKEEENYLDLKDKKDKSVFKIEGDLLPDSQIKTTFQNADNNTVARVNQENNSDRNECEAKYKKESADDNETYNDNTELYEAEIAAGEGITVIEELNENDIRQYEQKGSCIIVRDFSPKLVNEQDASEYTDGNALTVLDGEGGGLMRTETVAGGENESDSNISESLSVSVDVEICVRVDLGMSSVTSDSLSPLPANSDNERAILECPASNEYSFSACTGTYKENGSQRSRDTEKDQEGSAEKIAKQIVERVLKASQIMAAEMADRAINERNKHHMLEISDYNNETETGLENESIYDDVNENNQQIINEQTLSSDLMKDQTKQDQLISDIIHDQVENSQEMESADTVSESQPEFNSGIPQDQVTEPQEMNSVDGGSKRQSEVDDSITPDQVEENQVGESCDASSESRTESSGDIAHHEEEENQEIESADTVSKSMSDPSADITLSEIQESQKVVSADLVCKSQSETIGDILHYHEMESQEVESSDAFSENSAESSGDITQDQIHESQEKELADALSESQPEPGSDRTSDQEEERQEVEASDAIFESEPVQKGVKTHNQKEESKKVESAICESQREPSIGICHDKEEEIYEVESFNAINECQPERSGDIIQDQAHETSEKELGDAVSESQQESSVDRILNQEEEKLEVETSYAVCESKAEPSGDRTNDQEEERQEMELSDTVCESQPVPSGDRTSNKTKVKQEVKSADAVCENQSEASVGICYDQEEAGQELESSDAVIERHPEPSGDIIQDQVHESQGKELGDAVSTSWPKTSGDKSHQKSSGMDSLALDSVNGICESLAEISGDSQLKPCGNIPRDQTVERLEEESNKAILESQPEPSVVKADGQKEERQEIELADAVCKTKPSNDLVPEKDEKSQEKELTDAVNESPLEPIDDITLDQDGERQEKELTNAVNYSQPEASDDRTPDQEEGRQEVDLANAVCESQPELVDEITPDQEMEGQELESAETICENQLEPTGDRTHDKKDKRQEVESTEAICESQPETSSDITHDQGKKSQEKELLDAVNNIPLEPSDDITLDQDLERQEKELTDAVNDIPQELSDDIAPDHKEGRQETELADAVCESQVERSDGIIPEKDEENQKQELTDLPELSDDITADQEVERQEVESAEAICESQPETSGDSTHNKEDIHHQVVSADALCESWHESSDDRSFYQKEESQEKELTDAVSDSELEPNVDILVFHDQDEESQERDMSDVVSDNQPGPSDETTPIQEEEKQEVACAEYICESHPETSSDKPHGEESHMKELTDTVNDRLLEPFDITLDQDGKGQEEELNDAVNDIQPEPINDISPDQEEENQAEESAETICEGQPEPNNDRTYIREDKSQLLHSADALCGSQPELSEDIIHHQVEEKKEKELSDAVIDSRPEASDDIIHEQEEERQEVASFEAISESQQEPVDERIHNKEEESQQVDTADSLSESQPEPNIDIYYDQVEESQKKEFTDSLTDSQPKPYDDITYQKEERQEAASGDAIHESQPETSGDITHDQEEESQVEASVGQEKILTDYVNDISPEPCDDFTNDKVDEKQEKEINNTVSDTQPEPSDDIIPDQEGDRQKIASAEAINESQPETSGDIAHDQDGESQEKELTDDVNDILPDSCDDITNDQNEDSVEKRIANAGTDSGPELSDDTTPDQEEEWQEVESAEAISESQLEPNVDRLHEKDDESQQVDSDDAFCISQPESSDDISHDHLEEMQETKMTNAVSDSKSEPSDDITPDQEEEGQGVVSTESVCESLSELSDITPDQEEEKQVIASADGVCESHLETSGDITVDQDEKGQEKEQTDTAYDTQPQPSDGITHCQDEESQEVESADVVCENLPEPSDVIAEDPEEERQELELADVVCESNPEPSDDIIHEKDEESQEIELTDSQPESGDDIIENKEIKLSNIVSDSQPEESDNITDDQEVAIQELESADALCESQLEPSIDRLHNYEDERDKKELADAVSDSQAEPSIDINQDQGEKMQETAVICKYQPDPVSDKCHAEEEERQEVELSYIVYQRQQDASDDIIQEQVPESQEKELGNALSESQPKGSGDITQDQWEESQEAKSADSIFEGQPVPSDERTGNEDNENLENGLTDTVSEGQPDPSHKTCDHEKVRQEVKLADVVSESQSKSSDDVIHDQVHETKEKELNDPVCERQPKQSDITHDEEVELQEVESPGVVCESLTKPMVDRTDDQGEEVQAVKSADSLCKCQQNSNVYRTHDQAEEIHEVESANAIYESKPEQHVDTIHNQEVKHQAVESTDPIYESKPEQHDDTIHNQEEEKQEVESTDSICENKLEQNHDLIHNQEGDKHEVEFADAICRSKPEQSDDLIHNQEEDKQEVESADAICRSKSEQSDDLIHNQEEDNQEAESADAICRSKPEQSDDLIHIQEEDKQEVESADALCEYKPETNADVIHKQDEEKQVIDSVDTLFESKPELSGHKEEYKEVESSDVIFRRQTEPCADISFDQEGGIQEVELAEAACESQLEPGCVITQNQEKIITEQSDKVTDISDKNEFSIDRSGQQMEPNEQLEPIDEENMHQTAPICATGKGEYDTFPDKKQHLTEGTGNEENSKHQQKHSTDLQQVGKHGRKKSSSSKKGQDRENNSRENETQLLKPSSDLSDDSADEIDDLGQYHPELYEKMIVPTWEKSENTNANVSSQVNPVEKPSNNEETKQNLESQHAAETSTCGQERKNEIVSGHNQISASTPNATQQAREKQHNDLDDASDGDSDDIDDSGQYHPELYVKMIKPTRADENPSANTDISVEQELENILNKIQNEEESGDEENVTINKKETSQKRHYNSAAECRNIPSRSARKNIDESNINLSRQTSEESTDSIDDTGQYHPELYEQQEWPVKRRRSIDISHYGEISGLSAVEIDLGEEADETVDPNVVKQKLEKWLKEERDTSIRKETERFIKQGLPEEQNEIKQRAQVKCNEQRRRYSRDNVDMERQNSQDKLYNRSRHNSQEGLYQVSRQNSQDGIYRSRHGSPEEMYSRSRQNSVEALYGRGIGLGDGSRQNSPGGKYSRRRQSSQDNIYASRSNSFMGKEYENSRGSSRRNSREGIVDQKRYVNQRDSYIRSRQNSGEDMYRSRHGTVRQGNQESNKSQINKRRDNYERSARNSLERMSQGSSDHKYKMDNTFEGQNQNSHNLHGFNEDPKTQRRDVIEKCTHSRHDDLYERKELNRKDSLELIQERNDRNLSSPLFDEGIIEGRLGRKSDYIEVKKFRRDNKNTLGSDKRKADFLTSAQLKIFCQPKKSPKPTSGPIDMLSVSIERPKSKENERKCLEKNNPGEKMKDIPEYPVDSLATQPKKFDVYRYEKHQKKGRKSNLKSDKDGRTGDQYNNYSGQFNESGFSHKDERYSQIYNRNVDTADISRLESYNYIDQYGKNRCAKNRDASLPTKVVTANTNQDNGEAFYSSNPDYVHTRAKYQQNLGGRKCPKSIDGVKDKGRMKIPTSSGETSKDGPLSLTDTFAPMDRGQNENHNLSQSAGRLSDSTTSLNNRQAPAKSPSRQNTLQKQTSIQSNQSEINGERKDDPHGIKFERLKNLEEDDLMAKIKEIIGHLEKLEDYHRGDGMRIQKMLGDMYWDYTHLREMIADCMAENGYAIVSMKMLKTLNSIGIFKNDDVWFPTYYTYNTMWNFSDASSNLAKTLSENDAVRLLTLNCGHKPYINALHSKNVFYVIKASLSILHNMARNSGMKHLFDENKTSETIMPFMDSEDEMLKILATLTIANIVDEEENKTVIAETGTIHCMVSWIEKAISLPRRRFKGFTPQELTEGLNKLAVNDSNKMRIVEEGAVPLFQLMLQHDDVREQSSAGRIIWTLSFDKDVRQKLIENTDLIAILEKLTESTNKSVQQNANGALWIIKGENDISRESKPKGTPTKSHVFLSYSWSDKDTVLQIRDKLRAEGYAIWIDIEKGSSASLEGMANAVENSAVVLICMSEKYKQNPNCRTESEYTFQLKKDYIPLMLQKKYRPDGWLGFILGAKLYFDFSGKYPFEKSLTGLLKELRGRGQVTPNNTPGSNDTSDGAMVTSQSLTSYASPGTPVPSNSVLMSMGQEELVKWLRVVKLTECIPAFLEFDGRLLMQLKQMRTEAPEFFYQCLEKRLNMSLIEILKFTRALEELH